MNLYDIKEKEIIIEGVTFTLGELRYEDNIEITTRCINIDPLGKQTQNLKLAALLRTTRSIKKIERDGEDIPVTEELVKNLPERVAIKLSEALNEWLAFDIKEEEKK